MLREFLSLPEGTLSGVIQPVGDIALADCLVVQELGSKAELRSNQGIIDYVVMNDDLVPLPMFVSGSLEAAIQNRARGKGRHVEIIDTFKGPSAAGASENLGTYGEWLQFFTHPLVQDGTYQRPAMATSGYNAGNSKRQAEMIISDLDMDMRLIIPEGSPRTSFDRHSNQIWTKSRGLWVVSSPLRIALLRRKGH